MKEREYKVYIHEFPNGKVYIGLTSGSLFRRWGSNGVGYRSQKLMWRAINRYGWDNIIHDVLDVDLTKDEAEEVEKEWIAYYNSTEREYGYNLREGGSTSKHTEESKKKMSQAQKGEKHSRSKKVDCYDINGNFIKTYCYLRQVEQDGFNHTNVGHCCNRKLRTSRGFIWRWHNEQLTIEDVFLATKNKRIKGADNSKAKPVDCFDQDGNLIKTYTYLSEVESDGFISSKVSACCRGKRKTHKGYIWKYHDRGDNNG